MLIRPILEAQLALLQTEWLLFWHPDRMLQDVLTEITLSYGTRDSYTAEQLCHAMDLACVLYFKVVLCHQRSVATTMLLRRWGLPAEFVIGARIIPFEPHAWVELDRVVINDKPYVNQIYRQLERC
jgi:hypothetical protein